MDNIYIHTSSNTHSCSRQIMSFITFLALSLFLITAATKSVKAQSIDRFLKNTFGVKTQSKQNPAARQEPRMDRRTRVEVQRALNEQGYDVGRPDGKFGRQTRQKIAQFQNDKGYKPTGYLTNPQLDILFDPSQSATAQTANAGNAISQAQGARAPVTSSVIQQQPKNLAEKYKGHIFSAGLGRYYFSYGHRALFRQKYLTNHDDLKRYRTVMLNLAIRLMNHDIDEFNRLNRKKVDEQNSENRKPKSRRLTHHHHEVFLEDILDHPRIDDIAKLILQTSYDARFMSEVVPLKTGAKDRNYIHLRVFDPAKIGERDAKFYLAGKLPVVEKLVKILLRNLPDEVYAAGNLRYLKIDPFDMKINPGETKLLFESWNYREGGSSKKLPAYTDKMQVYQEGARVSQHYQMERKNDAVYTWPSDSSKSGVRLVRGNDKRRVGEYILKNMRELDDLIANSKSLFLLTDRVLDLSKANIPPAQLEALSKFLGSRDEISWLAQAHIPHAESADQNNSVAIEFDLQKLILFDHKSGKIVLELTPDIFPWFADISDEERANLKKGRTPVSLEAPFHFRTKKAEVAVAPKPDTTDKKEESAAPVTPPAPAEPEATEKAESPGKAAEQEAQNTKNTGPVDGWYYFTDRNRIKNMLELRNSIVCVPKSRKLQYGEFLKSRRIGFRIWQYKNGEEAIKLLGAGFCYAVAVPEDDQTTYDIVNKDLDAIPHLPPAPDENKLSELRDDVFASCDGNAFMRVYVDCTCLADEYKKSIAEQKQTPRSKGQNIHGAMYAHAKCVNREGIINDEHKSCYSSAVNDKEITQKVDPDAYCLCLANRLADKYEKKPKLSTQYISSLTANTRVYDKKYCMK